MEETAEEYYRELIMRNLLQPYYEEYYKMHDLLHCLARYLARDESLVVRKVHEVRSSNGPMKLRRLYVIDHEMTEIPHVLVKQNSLRTLMWKRSPMSETQMDLVFNRLSCLRVLDISRSEIQGVPDSLGNLVHLRYLNISGTKISVLPETTGNLRNLQFLIIMGCWFLSRLPNGIVNLHNLRSLDLEGTGVVGMPEGLGRLQNLHLLHGFKLQRNRSEGWCMMEELRSLSCLTDLSIDRLERTSGASEARAAELGNKPKLRILRLSCTLDLQHTEKEKRRIEEVFEELHPPPCLEELQITRYFGREFPKWMAETSPSTSVLLSNLRRLCLSGCNSCERLPPFGLLPNLEGLCIWDAASVIDVGSEFLIGTGSSSRGGDRAGVDSSMHAFPTLEALEFHYMPNWQKWRWDKGTQAMPCLKYLKLWECPKLMSLPEGLLFHATSLTTLVISGAKSLTTIGNLISLKELYIINNPNLEKVSDLTALTTLEVAYCPALQVVDNLQSLKRMKLLHYEMKSFPSYLPKRTHRPTRKRKVLTAHLEKLEIRCSMELIRNICQRASPEWQIIQGIQQVRVYSEDESVHVFYNKSPFTFTTNFNITTGSSCEMPPSSSGVAL
ncbi:putative disease resistance protein RGA3 [Cocos nucifera]|nr:putative disease resistance protein RGA3 [Cocos nucifera]